jgi:uncharacterized protein YbjT (DUF2867 family)
MTASRIIRAQERSRSSVQATPGTPGDTRRRWVSTGDIAGLVASVAVEFDPPSLITVGGPEAMTKNEAVAFVEKVLDDGCRSSTCPGPSPGWQPAC